MCRQFSTTDSSIRVGIENPTLKRRPRHISFHSSGAHTADAHVDKTAFQENKTGELHATKDGSKRPFYHKLSSQNHVCRFNSSNVLSPVPTFTPMIPRLPLRVVSSYKRVNTTATAGNLTVVLLEADEMNAVKGYVKILPQAPSGSEPLQHGKKISALFAACFLILVVAAGFALVGFLHGKNTHKAERAFHGFRCSDLIETVCNKTRYYEVCTSSLRAHPGALQANLSELARIALEVSRDVAKDAVQVAVDLNRTAPGSRAPLEDCVGLLGDSVDELNASLSVMGDENWRGRREDVQTWLSAALTDLSTCTEGFEEVGVSMPGSLKQKVDYLSELVSNALAIFNYIAGAGANVGKPQKSPGMNRRLLSGGK